MAEKKLEVSVILSAYDRMTRVVNSASNNAIAKLNKIKKSSDALSKSAFATGRQAFMVGAAIATPIVGAVVAAAKFEDKMADVAKVMNLKIGSKEFKDMSTQAKTLSEYLAIMPNDAAGLMAALAQGGVLKKDMSDVAKIAGEMSIAFGIGADAAGEQFIKSKNALGGTIPQIKSMMDAINHLSDNDASKASEILTFMAAGGSGVARTLAVAAPQMSAFGSSLISIGKSGAESATIIERFQKGIFENAGMKSIFDKAGGGASGMMAILEKGTALKGDAQFAFFSKFGLYGTSIMQMAQSLGHVKDNMKLVGDSGNYMNSVTNEFNNRNSTTIGKFNKLKSQLMVVAINLGENLLPAVTDLVTALTPMIKSVSLWIQKNQGLVTIVMKLTAGLAAVSFVISGLSFAVGAIAKVVSVGASAFTFFLRAVKAVQFGIFALRYAFITSLWPAIVSATTAVWAFTVALLANPITWIVVGVMALVAAGILLYKNWDKVKAFFVAMWPKIKSVFLSGVMFIKNLFLKYHPLGIIINNWGSILKFLGGLGGKFYKAGANIISSMWNGIKSMASKPIQAISNITKAMREYLPFSPAKKGAFTDLHKVKIVETIAGSMRSAPLVKAMANTTSQAGKAGGGGSSAGGAGGGGSIVINYSPVINGGGDDFKSELKKHATYLAKVLQNELSSKQRLKFS